jgi:hypothetical protein
MENLDRSLYGAFLAANPEFFALTEQRVASYWNCYYSRRYKRKEYAGFQVINYFKSLIANHV